MITFLITAAVGAGVYFLFQEAGVSQSWTIFAVVCAVLLSQIGSGLIIRRMVMKKMNGMTAFLQGAGDQLRKKYEALASRGGNMKTLMEQAQREEAQIYREALTMVDQMECFRFWTLFFNRQLAAIRLQFLLRIKETAKADALLDKVTVADPGTAGLILARRYQRGEIEKAEKLYKKYAKRFKAKGELVYAAMSWIYVRENRIDDAIKVLIDGRKATDSAVLTQNWEHLVNQKVNKFSNAALQEQWYALGLEEPKVPKNAGTQPPMQPQYRQYISGRGRGAARH